MDPLLQLSAATAAFILTHFVSSTPLRARIAASIGERGYLGAYSLVALAALGWMIYAYGRAPVEPLWPGLRLVPVVVMPFAFVFIVAGLTAKNPTAVGQQKLLDAEDPARGILRVTRHPLMWGILLWAGAHVLARGDAKSLLFFGGFLFVAGLGTRLIDARKARDMPEAWQRFAAMTSNVPFVAIAQGRNRFRPVEVGFVKVLVALIVYGGTMLAHRWLFGVLAW